MPCVQVLAWLLDMLITVVQMAHAWEVLPTVTVMLIAICLKIAVLMFL